MPLFRVPKVTEYALRSLSCLARAGQRLPVHAIASREHIHAASLAKILQTLSWQGLVHSKRGRQGGFWLARDPADIRLREVVEIFQGPLDWPPGPAWPSAWESLYASTRRVVEQLTLADLVRPAAQSDTEKSAPLPRRRKARATARRSRRESHESPVA
jgi:DNA-binding IscR family transcriptional regulator